MKSVVWIYTVNTDGVVIRSSGSGMMWISSKKFQDKRITTRMESIHY